YSGAFPSLAGATAASNRLNPLADMQIPSFSRVGSVAAPAANLSSVRGFGTPTQAGTSFVDRTAPGSNVHPSVPMNTTEPKPRTYADVTAGNQGSIDSTTGQFIPPGGNTPQAYADYYGVPVDQLPPGLGFEHGGMAQGSAIEVLTGERSKGDKPNPEVVQVMSRDPETKVIVTPIDKLTEAKGMPKAETGGVYGNANTGSTFTFNQ